ncbi:hypothetical protein C4K07_3087 [Pseudomonas chlororaphis subsp. aureofaciens]|uniref:Uncharacterized protein n=1 Tax=Pseudomonas chlororaphis subsp. aureofaciens TaxID=587851 RepID=A0AAD0ZEP9_9PSED|nr:hypothetical protein C4K07_3087 [Pseudomonas chlororaphis subsp. aureofaciens]
MKSLSYPFDSPFSFHETAPETLTFINKPTLSASPCATHKGQCADDR